MAEVSAGMVKDLRDKTGAGMMDCKKALAETAGDVESAIDWLRKKGLSKAAKKAGNVAAEGLVGLTVHGHTGAIVEVNSQTDFVARNEEFQAMVAQIAKLAPGANGDVGKLGKMLFPGAGHDVEGQVAALSGKTGEKMTLRRTAAVHTSPGIVASYIHNAPPGVSNLGKIGVLVALKSSGDADKLAALGRQIAMHIASDKPIALTADQVDPAVIEREKAIFAEQSRASGKPDNIIAKMVEGRLRKFYEEVVLLNQKFIMDPDKTVESVLKAAEKDIGAPVSIAGFVCYVLGEGIQKEETDFAA